MTQKKFTFIDLFAGIGGFHIAMHNVGGECVFAAEWDENCRKTYEENFKKISPNIFKNYNNINLFAKDITKVDIDSIPKHDVLCAGFPCQPFSQAGYKLGFEDTRGTLFFNVADIVRRKKPKVVFLENVRGLLKHDEGKTFNVIKNTLYELGYSVNYKIIKASDFGLPQHKPRIYIICIRNDIKDTFKFPESIPLQITMSDIFDGAEVNKKIGYTLRVGGKGSPIGDRRNWDGYWDGYLVNGEVRRLKPKEGKRMQGFPENFIFPISDSIAMKQLGNSVAIPAVQACAKKIIEILEETKNVEIE